MTLLLATYAFVWMASDPIKIPSETQRLIRRSADELYLSSISAMEIGILVHRGLLVLPLPSLEFIKRALTHHGINDLPVDCQTALRATEFPSIHNDSFDRLIIATAQKLSLKIVFMDQVFPRYLEVEVVWR